MFFVTFYFHSWQVYWPLFSRSSWRHDTRCGGSILDRGRSERRLNQPLLFIFLFSSRHQRQWSFVLGGCLVGLFAVLFHSRNAGREPWRTSWRVWKTIFCHPRSIRKSNKNFFFFVFNIFPSPKILVLFLTVMVFCLISSFILWFWALWLGHYWQEIWKLLYSFCMIL